VTARKLAHAAPGTAEPIEAAFAEVVSLIQQARQRAYQAVNTELVGLYWQIGEYIRRKLAAAEWGEGVVDRLAQHLAHAVPGQRGFTRRNLFRMRQFYEAYVGDEKVTPLVTQLPWTHNLIILGQSNRVEEREFYLRVALQQHWGKRELERQFRMGAFERAVLDPPQLSPAVKARHGAAGADAFKDAYAVEFLNLPADHSEADLHRGLLGQLRAFLIELGRDFCFVGSEFPLQVGGAGLCARPAVLSPRAELPGRRRTEGGPLRAGASGQAELLPRSAGPRCPQAA
jgi:predicted nuclease of restriction endonuclease-like (RecB) superfamily